MGFTLKKIIGALIMPLPFFMLVGLIGLWYLHRNRIKRAKKFLIISFIGIFIFSYNPISNALLHSLESQYQAPQKIIPKVHYVLLLGGDFDRRAYGVLTLYHKNPHLIIITSGHKGREEVAEAIKSKQKLMDMGIPAHLIIAHSTPKDTIEEAQTMKKLVGTKPFYLVSSASHLPRAMALFQKQGLKPIAMPSGYLEKRTLWLNFISANEAYKTQIALHEYIGLLWGKIKGSI